MFISIGEGICSPPRGDSIDANAGKTSEPECVSEGWKEFAFYLRTPISRNARFSIERNKAFTSVAIGR
jgi:hypothetical protein